MYISITDLLIFIIVVIGSVAGIFLIITLLKLNRVISKVDKFVGDNSENATKTIEVLPDTVKNVGAAAASICKTSDSAGNAIESIGETISDAATTVEGKAEGILTAIDVASELIKVIPDIISKFRK
jgi:uncharacterized protein YjbJ (UPF0337 family)